MNHLANARHELTTAWSQACSQGDMVMRDKLVKLIAGLDEILALPATEQTKEVWLSEVRALKEAGNTISAIKLYRNKTGISLREAQFAVETLK